jgi:hypothetical protein
MELFRYHYCIITDTVHLSRLNVNSLTAVRLITASKRNDTLYKTLDSVQSALYRHRARAKLRKGSFNLLYIS